MASDGEKKDKDVAEDPFLADATEEWDDAVEEWGSALDLPDEPPFGTSSDGHDAEPALQTGEEGTFVLARDGRVRSTAQLEAIDDGEPEDQPPAPAPEPRGFQDMPTVAEDIGLMEPDPTEYEPAGDTDSGEHEEISDEAILEAVTMEITDDLELAAAEYAQQPEDVDDEHDDEAHEVVPEEFIIEATPIEDLPDELTATAEDDDEMDPGELDLDEEPTPEPGSGEHEVVAEDFIMDASPVEQPTADDPAEADEHVVEAADTVEEVEAAPALEAEPAAAEQVIEMPQLDQVTAPEVEIEEVALEAAEPEDFHQVEPEVPEIDEVVLEAAEPEEAEEVAAPLPEIDEVVLEAAEPEEVEPEVPEIDEVVLEAAEPEEVEPEVPEIEEVVLEAAEPEQVEEVEPEVPEIEEVVLKAGEPEEVEDIEPEVPEIEEVVLEAAEPEEVEDIEPDVPQIEEVVLEAAEPEEVEEVEPEVPEIEEVVLEAVEPEEVEEVEEVEPEVPEFEEVDLDVPVPTEAEPVAPEIEEVVVEAPPPRAATPARRPIAASPAAPTGAKALPFNPDEELDFDDILSALDDGSGDLADQTAEVAEPAELDEQQPAPLPLEPEPLELAPPQESQDLFNEVVTPLEEPAAPEPEPAQEAAHEVTWSIPVELSDEDLTEPELAPPALPVHLAQVDCASFQLPEQGQPLTLEAAQWSTQAEQLQQEAEAAAQAPHGAALEFLAAQALERGGDAEGALGRYGAVLQAVEGHVPTLRAMQRLHTRLRQPDQLAQTLGQLAEHAPEGERQGLLAARADLLWTVSGDRRQTRKYLDQLGQEADRDLRTLLIRADLAAAAGDQDDLRDQVAGLAELLSTEDSADPANAAALLVEQARSLEAAGQHQPARENYQRAQQRQPLGSATEGLIRTCQALDDHAGLADALSAGAEGVGVLAGRRRRRAAMLARYRGVEQLDVCGSLVQAEAALAGDPLILEDLAESRQDTATHADAAQTYLQLADAAADKQQRALALGQAALLYEQQLGDGERALELFGEAAMLLPDYRPAVDGILRLKLAAQDPATRVEAHQAAIAAASEGEVLLHHLAAAGIMEQELQQPQEAANELERCLDQEPTFRPALMALEHLHRQAGQLDRYAAMLESAADSADCPDEVVELREQAALLLQGQLEQVDQGLRIYRQILEFNPDHPAFRQALLRCLWLVDRPADLAEELMAQADVAEDHGWAATLWYRRAAVLDGAGDEEGAQESLQRALERVSDHLPTLFNLTLNHAGQQQWDELAALWRKRVESLPEQSAQRTAMLMRLAVLHEVQMGAPAEAADLYHEAREAPGDVAGAREGLLRVLTATKDNARMAAELDQVAAGSQDAALRFSARVAAGELLRQSTEGWKKAERMLRKALRDQPDNPLGRQALEDLYLHEQQWEPMSELLLQNVGDHEDPQRRAEVYERLAKLDIQQDDLDSARRSYESIVGFQPNNLMALRQLQRIYLAQELWAGLPKFLRREAEVTQDHAEAASLWCELGRLLATRALNPDAPAPGDPGTTAHGAYQAALQHDPRCQPALRYLIDHAWLTDDEQALGRFHEELARALNPGREAGLFLTRASEYQDPADYTMLKEVVEQHLPTYLTAIYHLFNRAMLAEDWETAAAAAEAKGRACHVKQHRAEAFLVAGELVRGHLYDTARAIANYQAAMEANPGSRICYEQLRELLQGSEQWPELAALMATRTRYERSAPALVELHRSLARVAREHTGDRELAKRHLRLLLRLEPNDLAAFGVLSEMYFEDQQWQEAAHALLYMVRLEQEPVRLRDLFLRLGLIYGEKTPDLKKAIASYSRAVKLDKGNLEALSRLSDLFLEAGSHNQALQATSRLYEMDPDTQRKVGHLLRIARIHEEGFKDVHKASQAFRQASEMAPDDLRAMEELYGFFSRQRDQRSLMVHLDRSITAMRHKLQHDPFDPFPYTALFKIFNWRQTADECLCAGNTLAALGQASAEVQGFLHSQQSHAGSVAGAALADPQQDRVLFQRDIPGGFRQVFQLLSDSFSRIFRGDIRTWNVKRGDRLTRGDHPIVRAAAIMTQEMGIPSVEIYQTSARPVALAVENTDPPAIILGQQLVEGATEAEALFLVGRSLWIIRKAMILPTMRSPEELELLVAGVVRQYAPEFQPPNADGNRLAEFTRQVSKAIPRKLRQELMPFALECSGQSVDLRSLGAAVIHSANRAGLLACGSILAAVSCLGKTRGQVVPARGQGDLAAVLRGNVEVEELLRFSVSDAYFAARRAMGISI